MARLVDRLQSDPELKVQVVAGADDICSACPHLSDGSCECPDHNVDDLDVKVIRQLGLSIGYMGNWSSIIETICENLSRGEIGNLCSDCRWKEFDFCTNGIEAIRLICSEKAQGLLG